MFIETIAENGAMLINVGMFPESIHEGIAIRIVAGGGEGALHKLGIEGQTAPGDSVERNVYLRQIMICEQRN